MSGRRPKAWDLARSQMWGCPKADSSPPPPQRATQAAVPLPNDNEAEGKGTAVGRRNDRKPAKMGRSRHIAYRNHYYSGFYRQSNPEWDTRQAGFWEVRPTDARAVGIRRRGLYLKGRVSRPTFAYKSRNLEL